MALAAKGGGSEELDPAHAGIQGDVVQQLVGVGQIVGWFRYASPLNPADSDGLRFRLGQALSDAVPAYTQPLEQTLRLN